MDHKDYLKSLAPETRARLTAKSDAAGLARLAAHLGLIALFGAVIAARPPLWPALLPIQGVLIAFLFTLQHETTHKTPFATEWLNEAVGRFCGVAIFQPFLWFRHFHLAHHRHTNDPERDPELAGRAKPESWGELALHLSCLLYWRDKAAVLWGNAFRPIDAPYLPARLHSRLRREARAMLGLYAVAGLLAIHVWPAIFWVWIAPLAFGFPALRLYLLAEHGRCPLVANMFDNTRTTYTNAAVRFLAWNMPYHAEHHVLPQAPFHQLPSLNREIRARLAVTSPGYAAFARDYVARFGA